MWNWRFFRGHMGKIGFRVDEFSQARETMAKLSAVFFCSFFFCIFQSIYRCNYVGINFRSRPQNYFRLFIMVCEKFERSWYKTESRKDLSLGVKSPSQPCIQPCILLEAVAKEGSSPINLLKIYPLVHPRNPSLDILIEISYSPRLFPSYTTKLFLG